MVIEQYGFCKKCYKKGKEPHFFEVSKGHESSICPKCGALIRSNEAIHNYKQFFHPLYRKADFYLFKAKDFEKAYESYATIISLKKGDAIARYGRILSLLQMSNLRQTYLNECKVMFLSERKAYLRQKSYRSKYYIFLRILNRLLEIYYINFEKLLVIENEDRIKVFHDSECVSLYYQRVYQLLEFKTAIREEYEYLLNVEGEESDCSHLINLTFKQENRLKSYLEAKRMDIDGNIYSFTKINRNGEAVTNVIENNNKKPIKRKEIYSLIKKNNTKLIKNIIFKDRKRQSYLAVMFYPLISFLLTFAIVSLVLALSNICQVIFLSIFALFMGASVAYLAFHFYWNYTNKKNRKSILLD